MMIEDKKYIFDRDLVGYGESGRDAQWPNGARIAVSVCVNYEEGAESTVLNGDQQSETRNWEKAGEPPFINARQPNVESDYAYGSRAGIWRLLRIFKEHSHPFTMFACGQALEKHPDIAKACVREGHEIAGHGYRWLDCRHLPPSEEKEGVKRAIKAIQQTAGVDPKGWYVGRISPNSIGVVWEAFKEMGVSLEWESDYYGDDVPVWVKLPHELSEAHNLESSALLHIPYSYDANDMKFHAAADGFGGASFYEYLKDSFDMLYEEGGKMMSIGIHARIVGKPGRARALQKFLEYISAKEGVWVTTRAEIAKHWRQTYPFDGKI